MGDLDGKSSIASTTLKTERTSVLSSKLSQLSKSTNFKAFMNKRSSTDMRSQKQDLRSRPRVNSNAVKARDPELENLEEFDTGDSPNNQYTSQDRNQKNYDSRSSDSNNDEIVYKNRSRMKQKTGSVNNTVDEHGAQTISIKDLDTLPQAHTHRGPYQNGAYLPNLNTLDVLQQDKKSLLNSHRGGGNNFS